MWASRFLLSEKLFPHCWQAKRLHSGVNIHVPVQGFFFTETSSTLLAGERLHFGVNIHVPVKGLFVTETSSTRLAGERRHSSVNFHVPVKGFFCD